MIYDELRGVLCREATIEDLERMYNAVEFYNVDDSMSDSMKRLKKRKLRKELKFGINIGDALVCEKDGELVGVYTGKDNFVAQLVNVGDIVSAVLLYKVVLCDLHNKFKESTFEVDSIRSRTVYDRIRTPSGKACTIDELGNGKVTVEAKNEIDKMYKRFVKGSSNE